jgi:predicted small lipoprotein YifL
VALAGCGRKGGLDLPPQASMQPTVNSAPVVEPDGNSAANKGSALFSSTSGVGTTDPTASKGAKKSFFLDPILGN